jgi:D-alanyl-D-alanine carboxypeptidase
MKKILLISISMSIGLAAIAQYANPSESDPGFFLPKNSKFPTEPGKAKDTIFSKPGPASLNNAENNTRPFINRSPNSTSTFDPTWAERFQFILDSVVEATNMKGASLAVLVPGQGLWTGVSGISGAGIPVTEEMRFGIGSNTKLFIAVTMLKLQEQGILSLEDQLYQWLPTYPHVDSTTTIRQLLAHQSGIFDFWNDSTYLWDQMMLDTSRFWTAEEVLATIGPEHFAPGHGYRYSNTGYLLAGMVIEAATGTSWVQKMHDFILDPQDMDSTFVGAFESRNGPLAHEWGNYIYEIANVPMTAEYSQVNAAGAMLSTAQEMVEWYHALFTGVILSDSSMQQLLNFDPISFYSLGLWRHSHGNHLIYQHDGAMLGFVSQMLYDIQSGAAFCLLMNDRNGDFYDRVNPLIDVLYEGFPKQQNDAGITQIVSPWGHSCDTTVIPSVYLINLGIAPLTSVTINCKIDEGTPLSFNWTGALNPGDSVNVVLPGVPAGDGIHMFSCFTTLPNGMPDGNIYNDTRLSNFVNNASPPVIAELNESFEGLVFPPAGWTLNSSSMFQWGQTQLGRYDGINSLAKTNYNDMAIGSCYDLETPLLNISGEYNTDFSFQYAYAMYPGYADSLQVAVSQDCGATWQNLFNEGGDDLATSEDVEGQFYPQTEDWRLVNFSLSPYEGDLLIRYRIVCGFSNNLYIDDVKVDQLTSTKENAPIAGSNVFPNPFNSSTTIAYTLAEPSQVTLRIYDGFSRQIAEPVNALQQNGAHKITWNAENLPAGVYYYSLRAGKQVRSGKMIVM